MMKKHDEYLNNLVLLVNDEYDLIQKNVEYPKNASRLIGEIDLFCIGEGGITIYEVKSSFRKDSLQKAVKQLTRAEQYFGKINKSYLYTPKYGIQSKNVIENYLKLPDNRKLKLLEQWKKRKT